MSAAERQDADDQSPMPRAARPRRRLGASLLPLVVLLAGPASAQEARSPAAAAEEPDRAALQQQFRELFQALLADPANLDLTFRYAEVAVALGNYEAAITALERMLFVNPDLPRVQLELGAIYFRLRSYGMARDYFEQANAAPDVPPDVRSKIREYLDEIAKLEKVHRFSGVVLAGAQYQSNPTEVPAAGAVRVNLPVFGVVDAALTNEFRRRADENLFAGLSAFYSYDLRDQNRDEIELAATAFTSTYFRQHRLNLDLVELSGGPRLRFPALSAGTSLKPYAIGDYVFLGRDPYYHSYGTGLDATQTLGERIELQFDYEHRVNNYHDSESHPASRQLTGDSDLLALSGSFSPTSDLRLNLTLNRLDQATRTPGTSYVEYAVAAGTQIFFADPTGLTDQPWQFAATIARAYDYYDAPDPTIDPDVTRRDRRWRFFASQSFAVTPDVSLVVQAQRDVVSSTVPNFAYTNWSFLIGPQIRF
jgi:tetratricopeptide (TPR) repeat protein